MLIIDFDGTIVDLWPRYHAVFCALTKTDISLYEYKFFKQLYKRDEDLMSHFGIKLPTDYFSKKAMCLEDPHFLILDKLLVSKEKLLQIATQNDITILTKRRNPKNFAWELKHLELANIPCKVICVNGSKLKWVTENIKTQALIIGDDVRDLQVATLPQIDAAMVLTGLGTKEDFSNSQIPHQIFDSLNDIL